MDYRTWLQRQVDTHRDTNTRKQAAAVLKRVGNDKTLDQGWLNNPFAVIFDRTDGYGKQSIINMNNNFKSMYDRDMQAIKDSPKVYPEAEKQNTPQSSSAPQTYDPYAVQRAQDRANEIASYREVERDAQDALGRLGKQREIGVGNIEQNFRNQSTELENEFAHNKGIYDLNTNETIAANQAARERIAENAGIQHNSLRKMFAAGGAGDSSAAKILAPYAVGLDASRQAADQQDEYARNRRDLDMEFTNVRNAYNKNRRRLEADRQDRINSLDSGIESSRIDLNDKIRQARQKIATASGRSLSSAISETGNLRNEIEAGKNRILDLSKATPVAINKVEFKAPKLSDYNSTINPGKIETGNPDQDGLTDQIDPRLIGLLDPEKKKRQLSA